MPSNTVQDRTLLAGLKKRGGSGQSSIQWLDATVAVGVPGQFTEVNLVGATVTTGPSNRITITVTGGGGTGTVTTVSSGNLNPLFTVNITNPTTTPAFAFTAINQNANLIYAGPATGAAAAPTFRALVAADLPTGTRLPIIVSLSADTQSTKFGSTTKLTVGRHYFDPTDARWGLTPTSTATFYALVETTNGTNTAACELYRETGTGSPVVVGTPATTNSTTAVRVSASVTAAFLNTSNSGIFAARVWTGTPNGNDEATCSSAWIEIIP